MLCTGVRLTDVPRVNLFLDPLTPRTKMGRLQVLLFKLISGPSLDLSIWPLSKRVSFSGRLTQFLHIPKVWKLAFRDETVMQNAQRFIEMPAPACSIWFTYDGLSWRHSSLLVRLLAWPHQKDLCRGGKTAARRPNSACVNIQYGPHKIFFILDKK